VGVRLFGRVAGSGDANSMLRFWLVREDDGMKCYWKMKQSQQAHHDSMGMKRDTAQWCDDVDWMKGDTVEGKGRRQCQLD
jgi:hypothetical protein